MNFEITEQGKPIVDACDVQAQGDNVIALRVDLRSKYCETSGFISDHDGTPGVFIIPTDCSLYLSENADQEETCITFPELKGWRVWSANIGRYTLAVCLIRYP